MSTVQSYNGPLQFCPGFRQLQKDYNDTAGLLTGVGTSSLPLTDAGVASKTFLSYYLKSTATSGTSRALRINFTCTGSQTADCARLVLTHSGSSSVTGGTQTVHATLGFGSSAGNLANSTANAALRGQVSIPNRALGSAVAPIYSEFYSEGTASDLTSSQGAAFFMAQNTGNATGMANVDTNGYFMYLEGFTGGSGKIFNNSNSLKIKIGASIYYIPTLPATTNGVVLGVGTSSAYHNYSDTADKEALQFYFSSAATSGTQRGMRLALKCTGGASADALRVVLKHDVAAEISGGTQAIHASLAFGTTNGNLNQDTAHAAVRGTVQIPNRQLKSAVAPLYGEFYSEGSASDLRQASTPSFIMLQNTGDSGGVTNVDDHGYLINVQGGSIGAGNIVGAAGDEPTWATGKTHLIRCNFMGTTIYLVGVTL